MTGPDAIGPWVPGLDPGEKLARLRSTRALCQIFCGPRHPLVVALAQAEVGDDEAALTAWRALETLPTLQRRRILTSMGTLLRQSPPIRERKQTHG